MKPGLLKMVFMLRIPYVGKMCMEDKKNISLYC
jgi:hypothetical protein